MSPQQALSHLVHRAVSRAPLEVLQVNLGRRCNQACRHCHVDAAPWRTEMMNAEVAGRVAFWIRRHRPRVVDLTGGAPELSPHFRMLVETARRSGCRVIDRNNLTIIETEAHGGLPEYLASHGVEVIASLPCYLEENVDAQRGDGVFEKSIQALRKLNAVGYGRHLSLSLVYNPLGARLPPEQSELESDYRTELRNRYGIEFTRLLALANQPIARFAEDLRARGEWDAYLELLATSFNPATLDGLMCRTTLSVGWTGEVYDCDFNQMLGMTLGNGSPLRLWDVTPDDLPGSGIRMAVHCLACTAGSGSGCGGALVASRESPEAILVGRQIPR
ncbi:MAG: arsenosugar biosynthesis radical SAM protein ArsS [Verrucomicrobiales bacterium]|nr:arsenosugar biosynthesis radical SAM protein ArsS [Verrucomicrobiales bacterium]